MHRRVLQMLGMFVVTATATGCLYFLDINKVASQAGITAAAILMMVLNACFVILMVALITRASLNDARACGAWIVFKLLAVRNYLRGFSMRPYRPWP